jgi:hypothetical protein
MDTYQINKYTRKNYSTSIKYNKTLKNNKIKKEHKVLARERFKERMNLPIGTSSIGFPLTDQMKIEIEKIKHMFR